MGTIHYLQAMTDDHLEQILELQGSNTEAALSREEVAEQGFVTVRHDLDLLREMNRVDQHIIALCDQQVIGYALVMQTEFESRLPVLGPLFDQIRSLSYAGRPVRDYRYFIMGQVCVARPFRGQGVFEGLYQCMGRCYAEQYDFVITEVAARNPRSIRAHEKVGFRLLRRYAHGEQWDLIYWDWQEA